MGLLGGVILALLLREAALGAGREKCAGEAGCDVTLVAGEVARLQCSGDIFRPSGQLHGGGGSEKKTEVGERDFFDNYNDALEAFDFDNESVNETLFNDRSNSSGTDVTELSETNTTALSETNNNRGVDNIYSVGSQYLSSRHFKNITQVELFLSNNITHLDLTMFPNVRTVIMNTSGYVFSQLCGGQNVTEITASSELRDVSFVRKFMSAISLNLSYNFLGSFPEKELPTNLVSLDLSYNRIIFYMNVSLQEDLRILNVSYNNASLDKKLVIKGNVIVLDLRGNRFEFVPSLETAKLEELYLAKNNITELHDVDFKSLSSLAVLDISENQLKHLEARVFQGLTKLQKLDLSANTILTFDPSNFQYLSNLIVLKLSQNINLGSLQDAEDPSLIFGPGQRLQVIEACAINLSRLPSTLTRSVKKLFLSDNTIHTIQCGELDSFPLLQEMDLSNNEVTEIEEDALGRLDFLSHLILTGNNLTAIPKSLPDQLEVLDLRCNFIQKLRNYELLGMQKLRVLLLSRNLISAVEDGAFGQLTSLEVLDLSHNPIKSLSRTSFLGPRRLQEIYLTSLTKLIPLEEPLSFPAPESAHLEVLDLESSPVLAGQLMDDPAALAMFHELFELNLSHCRLTELRADLPKYLPRLHRLAMAGNIFNCTDMLWLVKWLQELNVSIQVKGRSRPHTYRANAACCGEVGDVDRREAMCATPENLSGKRIIALKEEDFPDSKLTSAALPARQLGEPYLATLPISAENASQSDVAETTLPINNSDEASSDAFTPTLSDSEIDTQPTNHDMTSQPTRAFYSDYYSLERPPTEVPAKKTSKSVNRSVRKWKYLKSETKYKPSTPEPGFVLLNDSGTGFFDNHVRPQESAGPQFLAHGPPPASHPGMVVFLLIVGVVLGASAAVVWSQCAQARARAARAAEYRPQQDIEVYSFGGTDLW